ncbi:MAG: CoA transferase, partial [Erythrobacter sp.]
ELTRVLDAEFAKQPMEHWQDLLAGHVPVAPVYTLADALDNPWLETTGMRTQVAHPDNENLSVLANPLRFDGERLPNRAAPLLGEDSDALLDEIGYDADAVADLRAKGVI